MTRYIGVDLHTNTFTLCILQEGQEDIIQTLPLQKGELNQFIQSLNPQDEVAVEATGNASYFCRQVRPHVKRVIIIAPWQFEVIRRSVKKTDRHDARAIAFFLSKDMLPEARQKDEGKEQHCEWDIELVFKRFKSLAKLGHLPKYDDDSSRAWLYGKLFVCLMTENLRYPNLGKLLLISGGCLLFYHKFYDPNI